jgi:hypothetical protein
MVDFGWSERQFCRQSAVLTSPLFTGGGCVNAVQASVVSVSCIYLGIEVLCPEAGLCNQTMFSSVVGCCP